MTRPNLPVRPPADKELSCPGRFFFSAPPAWAKAPRPRLSWPRSASRRSPPETSSAPTSPTRHHLGMMAESLIDQGKLVPDELVNQMVAERLSQPDTRRGYILDGFPRTLNQATWLDALSGRRSNHTSRRGHQHRGRIRRSSPAASPVAASRPHGRIYNIYSNPPQFPASVM